MSDKAPIVEMQNIHKHFGPAYTQRGVDLAMYQNEVPGLVGDNAAGKLTMMKILAGIVNLFYYLNGEEISQ